MALNKITGVSKEQDWEVHAIEHQVGAYTDCTHGAGLAVVSIPYYKYIYRNGIAKFVRFAKNVWHIDTDHLTDDEAALAGIDALAKFIVEMGLPTRLRDLGTTEDMITKIAKSTVPGGGYRRVEASDIEYILRECF